MNKCKCVQPLLCSMDYRSTKELFTYGKMSPVLQGNAARYSDSSSPVYFKTCQAKYNTYISSVRWFINDTYVSKMASWVYVFTSFRGCFSEDTISSYVP